MPFIKKSSIQKLNLILDPEWMLSECGAYPIYHDGPVLRALCPSHDSAYRPNMYVRLGDNKCWCEFSFCKAHECGSLIRLYALTHDCTFPEAAIYWAEKVGFELKFDNRLAVKAPSESSPTGVY